MQPVTKFGVISDCQYTDEDDESYEVPATTPLRYNCQYRDSPRKLREAIEYFNTQDLDFVVHLGDFVDRKSTEAELLNSITSSLTVPLWHILGNHEFKDTSTPISEVIKLYSMPSSYYSKVVKNYRFIMLDSNEVGVIAHKEGSEGWKYGRELLNTMKDKHRINAYPWNGGISQDQLKWLKDQLNESNKRDQLVIIFSHHPIFPPGPLNMLNDSKLLSIINNYGNVKAFFNGHNHLGNYGVKNNIPYITASGIVEGVDNAYGVVNLYSNGSGTLTGSGRQLSYQW